MNGSLENAPLKVAMCVNQAGKVSAPQYTINIITTSHKVRMKLFEDYENCIEDSIILMNYVFLLSILLSPSLTDFFKGHMVSFLCLKPGKKIDSILAVGVTSLML